MTRQIAEPIAARGRPRGCYEWALVRPGRDYGIYRCSGRPRGCYEWVWPGATRQIAESITTQPFNCRSKSFLDATEVATYVSVMCHMRFSNELQH